MCADLREIKIFFYNLNVVLLYIGHLNVFHNVIFTDYLFDKYRVYCIELIACYTTR